MSKSSSVHLALFLVSLIYGATFSIAKEVMPIYIKPMGLIAVRVWGATLLLWITHALFVKEKLKDKKDLWQLAFCSVVGVAANMLLFFKGLAITTPINGAILMVTTPLFVAVFAFIILKEKVTLNKVLGLVLGLTGAVLLLTGPTLSFRSNTLWGDFMVMLNAIIYAYYLIIAKPLLHKYSTITVLKWTFLFGSIFVAPFGFSELNEVVWTSIPKLIWWSIVFLVFGATYLTYLLNGWALRYANSSLVGTYIYLQPVLASFIAIALGKDSLTWTKIGLSLLIFLGVYLVSLSKFTFSKHKS